jgi:hypothetical protein
MESWRLINAMQKSRTLMQYNLAAVTQAQASAARDGADGWTALEALCHVRDFDAIFFERAQLAASQEHPILPRYNHLGMMTERAYAQQDFQAVLAGYQANRQRFIEWLQALPEAEWSRTAEHPEAGSISIYEIAMQAALHDLDHLEQILRSLASL